MVGSFRFGELAFDAVSRIEPERGPSGDVLDFTPHVKLDGRLGLNLLPGGEGPFCKFSISNQWLGRPGVYVFLVDGSAVYVGECECLVKRVNQGYGSIAPRNCFVGGQSTNVRINRFIRDAVLRGKTVELAFCCTDSRKAIESEMISRLAPPWNRASRGRSVSSSEATKSVASQPQVMNRLLPSPTSACREQILRAVRDVVQEKGRNEFTVSEIVNRLRGAGAGYADGTIRTHITSRCCRNAPKNHAVVYEDFERIARGVYRVV
jgi:hypothetical protein